MATFKCFASLVLAATFVPVLAAKTHCPGNAASVPFHIVNRYQIVLAVFLNHTGPYRFLLDSGTQITMIDPSIAAELHLGTQGAAVVVGAGSRRSASFSQLDLVEVGSHAVADQKVLVYDLFHSSDLHLQGILGEDFLEHFAMLMDNANSLLCLVSPQAMRAEVKGPHIPLVPDAESDGIVVGSLPIIAVRLSGGMRPVRLLLDSGANAPILYNTSQYIAGPELFHDAPIIGSGVDGTRRIFCALPVQDVRIASLALSGVAFFSLPGREKDASVKGFDGVLPTRLFRRVFIDQADHFAILEP
jgi:hypothetical protein